MPPTQKIKPTKTKAQIRLELEQEISRYLSQGGQVESIPTGLSGNESNKNIFSQTTHFEPKKDRTPVTDVVKELEARKQQKKSQPTRNNKKPRKILIKDDFGEPIRWVWEEKWMRLQEAQRADNSGNNLHC